MTWGCTESQGACVGTTPGCYLRDTSMCCRAGPLTATCQSDVWVCPVGRVLGSECAEIRLSCDGVLDAGALDGGRSDAAPMDPDGSTVDPTPALTVSEAGGARTAADFDCLGGALVPGTDVPIRFVTLEGMPRDNADLSVFPDDVPDVSTCTPPCRRMTTDPSGSMVVAGTSGRFAYRFDTPLQVGHHVEPRADGVQDVPLISSSDANLLMGLAGASGPLRLATMVVDCQGRAVAGARLRVYAGGDELAFNRSGTSAVRAYIDPREIVSTSAEWTTETGSAVFFDLDDSASVPLRVEAWGRIDATSPNETRISCAEVFYDPRTITSIMAGPVRDDAPSECAP